MPRNIILPHRHSTMALIGLHWDIYAVSGTSPVSTMLFHFFNFPLSGVTSGSVGFSFRHLTSPCVSP